MSWVPGESELRWPWLVVALGVLVAVLLLVWLRVWWRRPPRSAAYVAHATRLRRLPRYRALVRRRALLGGLGSAAALVACAGAILLGGRLQQAQTLERDDVARDIMLCLDASGSTAPWNVDVVQELRDIVEDLEGERIGLTVWNNAAITKFPLTDDYEFVLEQLEQAELAFSGWTDYLATEEYYAYTAGTFVSEFDRQSSLVGDGLVSCVQRFDRPDEDRGRALVLATDGEQRGRGVFSIEEAGAYADDQGVVVHTIANPGEPAEDGDLDELRAAARATGGTYALLGSDGTAEEVVDSIDDLRAARIERPPLRQVVDRNGPGTVVAGIGVGLLLVGWAVEWLVAARGRRPGR
ncbi:VWA domain-containing protein [Nocardioides sp. TF02-7]|uniref:VWA domain-containing protein n=1 Tax=Nocardioides sp. TF02-7 TaxID=2917724 RepID=UPI001F0508A7|nr:VWA domain-containing protein [Nocardioides sp. TF02-7]UMG93448.1 VWA domain-containing protein [Nocardioides sp. TF02-7]